MSRTSRHPDHKLTTDSVSTEREVAANKRVKLQVEVGSGVGDSLNVGGHDCHNVPNVDIGRREHERFPKHKVDQGRFHS